MKASHTLTVNRREKTGSRYAQRERAAGLLPTVLYGRGKDPVHLTLNAKEAMKFFNSGERVFTVELEDASDSQLVMLKDVHFDYLGTNVVHADLVRVELDDEVDAHVPIKWAGEPIGLKTAGAVLVHQTNSLTVKAKVRDMPEQIIVDLSALEAGTVFHASDLKLEAGLAYQGDGDDVIASITTKLGGGDEGAEGESVAGGSASPEVIGEKKDED